MMSQSIGEIAREAGIETSAIRYYEQIGLLPHPTRINGRRAYDASVLWRLTLIQRAKRAGFTLGEIRRLLHGFPREASPAARWQSMTSDKLDQIDQQIAELEQMRTILAGTLECQCQTLADCANALPKRCS